MVAKRKGNFELSVLESAPVTDVVAIDLVVVVHVGAVHAVVVVRPPDHVVAS